MNKVELLFGIGGGFKLILDEVKLKGGEFSKGAPIVYVKSGGILEMNGGAITEARVDEAVPSCVRIAGGGIFIMNGTVINGENAVGRRGDQCCRGRNIGHERRTSQLGHQQWND